MSAATAAALDVVATSMPMTEIDRADVTAVIAAVETLLIDSGNTLSDDRRLALAAHSLAFVRRIRTREELPEIDLNDFPEIPEGTVQGLRSALAPYCAGHDMALSDEEVLLFAMHVEVARIAP